MYIKSMTIKNFRVFNETGTTFSFINGLNAIIGANNVGKSSMIDAIRICFNIFDYHKDIYFSINDFHTNIFGIKSNSSEISFEFADVQDSLMEIIDPLKDGRGLITFKFYLEKNSKGIEKIKYKVWGGGVENNPLSQDFFDSNFSIYYLNALRNVGADLLPNRSSIVSTLIKNTFDPNNEDKIVSDMKDLNEKLLSNDKIIESKKIINNNISDIEGEHLCQTIDFEFVDPKFDKIISSIKSKILSNVLIVPEEKVNEILELPNINDCILYNDNNSLVINKNAAIEKKCFLGKDDLLADISKTGEMIKFELSQNGLGYNNVLYIATVLGNMDSIKENDLLNVFLIEEPEAHLHPQLQKLLQLYFDKIGKNKNIQIIYTTHSPSLASSANMDSINIMFKKKNIVSATTIDQTKLCLEEHRNYIRNFLDVSKSQMLFAKGVLFVEGISEAIIINAISEALGKSLSKYQIEIVNINGVAFSPFVEILTKNDNSSLIHAAIITDDDRCTKKDGNYISKDIDYDYNNMEEIIAKINNATQSDRCDVLDSSINGTQIIIKKAQITLEYEIAKNNLEICMKILDETHPTLYRKINEIVNANSEKDDYKAIRFWLLIRNRPEFKSEFARKILTYIEQNNTFVIPNYIKEAINELIERVKYELE